MSDLETFIRGIPKCELHMHLLGNIEPEMVFQLAQRNSISLPYPSAESLRASYNFQNLDEFLDLFRQGTRVIQTEQDLYDVTWDYLVRAKADNVRYCELHYSPYDLMVHGMSVEEAMNGVVRALDAAKAELKVESGIVICALRHCPESESLELLEKVQPWRKYFVAGGLASSERAFPPRLFVRHFEEVRRLGLKVTIHAGEDGPVEYIDEALTLLQADRIDHGNACEKDEAMIERLKNAKIPLTMCPLSNLKLKVIEKLSDHPLKKLLDAGVIVSVNSDDPSFFGGYVNDNYIAVQQALGLTRDDIVKLAKNSYVSSFLSEDAKQEGLQSIDEYVANFDAGRP
jgi:adenosine deaminase